jgi:hypothetical protein
MSQPTPSTAVNTLVELASNVANKQAEPEALHQVLDQRLEMLLASREDFEKKAEAMGEAFTIPHADLIDRVHECYDQYEQSLQTMMGYFESGNAQDLHNGSKALIEVTVPMTETVQEYVKTLVSFGPSPYPIFNGATNILRSIATQGVPREVLTQLIDESVAFHNQALAEIDASPAGKQAGYQDKRVAIELIITAVKGLKPVASEDEIDGALAELQAALDKLTAADKKIFEETIGSTPTAMPAANLLINTARGVISGIYNMETLVEALQWYKDALESVEEQFNRAVEGETDSAVILDELPKTREIIDQHDEVIADLEETFDDFTAENVEPILEELIEVIERLKDSSEVYMDAAKREGKLVCLGCGHPNPPTNRSCEECGQRLPQMVDPTMFAKSTMEFEERSGLSGDEPIGGVVTENTYKLFEVCEKFFAQKITEADFRKVLDWSRQQVEISRRTNKRIKEFVPSEEMLAHASDDEAELLEDNRKLFQDTKELFEDGAEGWLEGLDLMEDYIETRHRPTLELGLQKVFNASQKLYSLQKIGELAQRALDELPEAEPEEGDGPPRPDDGDGDGDPLGIEQHEYIEGEGGLA